MKVVFKEEKTIKCVVPVLGQIGCDSLFIPMALALVEDELLVFDDSNPSSETEDSYYYEPVLRIPLEQLALVRDEKIIKNKDLKEFRRIHLINQDIEKSLCYYYDRYEEKRYARNLLVMLKQAGRKVKKGKVNLGPLI